MENVGGNVYGKATGLYNKHRNYSEQWNPWHPFWSADDFQQAQSFGHQSKTWIDQHLTCGLDNYTIESFQLAASMRKLLLGLDSRLGDDSLIDDDSHIFGTLYYRDNFPSILFLLAHLPFQAHLDFQLVRLTNSGVHRIYSEMNTGDRWWHTQDQLPYRVIIVSGICASDKTHQTNFSGNQLAWPLYLTIGNIRKNICVTAETHAWILVGLIP